MILITVPKDEYTRRGVPKPLQKAVQVLNELIAIDAYAVSHALDHGDYMLSQEVAKKIEGHPSVILGEFSKPTKPGTEYSSSGIPALSGLGVLNGIVGTEKFRLYVETGDDNWTYSHVGIKQVLDGEPNR